MAWALSPSRSAALPMSPRRCDLTDGAGRLELAEATGMPAILLRTPGGGVRGVVVVESRRHLVIRLWAMFNPAKLTMWT
ncbi:hypothetical protein [Microbacterium elymi]|uniref:Uncharacterized protein n=1 Tax=Microbacterium elymi TaxID=2909587 RepID=A0ABY5NLG7_9MICO|nr:hypothetical protein [Microbacterium elymi]UUT36036.1 hypothetical protein L2X98_23325 [Microbacterium elymi]